MFFSIVKYFVHIYHAYLFFQKHSSFPITLGLLEHINYCQKMIKLQIQITASFVQISEKTVHFRSSRLRTPISTHRNKNKNALSHSTAMKKDTNSIIFYGNFKNQADFIRLSLIYLRMFTIFTKNDTKQSKKLCIGKK